MINTSLQEKYDELSYYTMSHPDRAFIHQHVVDAFTAQNADPKTKPVAITFALVGLYLAVEKGFSGKHVQNIHIALAKKRKSWPEFSLPEKRGEITIEDVLIEQPGEKRDKKIKDWCKSVWDSYREDQQKVRDLVKKELDI